MTTTAARSRDYMRKLGWFAEVVEHRQGKFHRKDLFNFGDVLAYKPEEGILIIQAYLKQHTKDHLSLDATNADIKAWLMSGGNFEHHVWKKAGKRGKRKQWVVTRVIVTGEFV